MRERASDAWERCLFTLEQIFERKLAIPKNSLLLVRIELTYSFRIARVVQTFYIIIVCIQLQQKNPSSRKL